MRTQSVFSRIRLGILALPLGSFMFLISISVDGPTPEASASVRAWAEYLSATDTAVANFLASVGQLLSIFGFIALYAFMVGGRAERWAFFGMVLCIPGLASQFGGILGASGIEAVAADQYLQGQRAVFEEWFDLFDWTSVFSLVLTPGLFSIGYVLLGVAIWRSRALAQGAAILWLAGLLFFFATTLTWWADVIAILVEIIAGGWIAWSVWQQPPSQPVESEAQTRVQ